MASSTALDLLLFTQKLTFHTSYIIFIAGLIGNSLNVLVFTSLNIFQNNQCVFYFTIEAFANILQLSIFFLIRLLVYIYGNDPASWDIFWCKFRSIMIPFCTLTAVSAICFSTYDQYLSTNYRAHLRAMSTIKLARMLTYTAITISLLHSIPFGIFLEIRASVCNVFDSQMSQYLSYFYYPILTGIIPIFISSLFSILAYRNVRRIIRRQIPIVRRRLDRQLTAMVLLRVIIFVILTLPYAMQRMYSFIMKTNPSDLFLYAVNSLISTITGILFNLNYAISFYLFMVSSVRFRRQVKYVLIKKYWRQWQRCCSYNRNQIDPNIEMQSTGSTLELD